MRLSYSETARVDMDTACAAAIEYLNARPRNKKGQHVLTRASEVAGAIWPNNEMTPQGAGGAASRILKRLKDKGRVFWTSEDGKWGWRLT